MFCAIIVLDAMKDCFNKAVGFTAERGVQPEELSHQVENLHNEINRTNRTLRLIKEDFSKRLNEETSKNASLTQHVASLDSIIKGKAVALRKKDKDCFNKAAGLTAERDKAEKLSHQVENLHNEINRTNRTLRLKEEDFSKRLHEEAAKTALLTQHVADLNSTVKDKADALRKKDKTFVRTVNALDAERTKSSAIAMREANLKLIIEDKEEALRRKDMLVTDLQKTQKSLECSLEHSQKYQEVAAQLEAELKAVKEKLQESTVQRVEQLEAEKAHLNEIVEKQKTELQKAIRARRLQKKNFLAAKAEVDQERSMCHARLESWRNCYFLGQGYPLLLHDLLGRRLPLSQSGPIRQLSDDMSASRTRTKCGLFDKHCGHVATGQNRGAAMCTDRLFRYITQKAPEQGLNVSLSLSLFRFGEVITLHRFHIIVTSTALTWGAKVKGLATGRGAVVPQVYYAHSSVSNIPRRYVKCREAGETYYITHFGGQVEEFKRLHQPLECEHPESAQLQNITAYLDKMIARDLKVHYEQFAHPVVAGVGPYERIEDSSTHSVHTPYL